MFNKEIPELLPIEDAKVKKEIRRIFMIGAVAPQNQKSPSTTTSEPMWSYNLSNRLSKIKDLKIHTFDIATLSLYRTLKGGSEVSMEEIAKLATKSRPDLIGFSLLP